MAQKKYSLTEEHRAQLKPWTDKWIATAMSTAPMSQEDKELCVHAVRGMYRSANLKTEPRVVFASSPLVAAAASGFAAAILFARSKGEKVPLDIKTTDSEIVRATMEALGEPPPKLTTSAPKAKPSLDRWFVVRADLRRDADALGIGKFGLDVAAGIWAYRQGGTQWAGWCAYLSFYRHVVKLGETHGVDFSKWADWETLSERGCVRFVHPDFCIISDRPRTLKVDEQNRPHCLDGPFCEWSDGFALYAYRGVRVPAKWILDKTTISPKTALTHPNMEERRAACEILGWDKILAELPVRILDQDRDPEIGTLMEVDLPDSPSERFLKVRCGTGRTFVLNVDRKAKTAREANASSFEMEADELELEFRT